MLHTHTLLEHTLILSFVVSLSVLSILEHEWRLGRQQYRKPPDHQKVKGEVGGGVSSALVPLLAGKPAALTLFYITLHNEPLAELRPRRDHLSSEQSTQDSSEGKKKRKANQPFYSPALTGRKRHPFSLAVRVTTSALSNPPLLLSSPLLSSLSLVLCETLLS